MNNITERDLDTQETRHCDECGSNTKYGIQIGDPDDYDSISVFLCVDCMGIVADKWCRLKELIKGTF